MVDLIWVKMPSTWVSAGVLRLNFSSKRAVSTDIAALKIFLYLCLFSEPVKRKKQVLASEWLPERIRHNTTTVVTQAEASITYDAISAGCSLSRKMVSEGLKKLISLRLIIKEGTTRKIRYVIQGSLDSGWAKLPKRELIKLNQEVEAFHSIKNRYDYERDAIKLFIYLLTVRTNRYHYIDVSRGKISQATGIELLKIDECLGYLTGLGLIEKVETQGYTTRGTHSIEENKLHRYYVAGSSGLVQKGNDISEVSIDISL